MWKKLVVLSLIPCLFTGIVPPVVADSMAWNRPWIGAFSEQAVSPPALQQRPAIDGGQAALSAEREAQESRTHRSGWAASFDFSRWRRVLFPLVVGAIVADIDLTLIRSPQDLLEGENLQTLITALQRGIPVTLITGSSYDFEHYGIQGVISVRARVVDVLRNHLRDEAHVLHHLTLDCLSGYETITFDEEGRENPVVYGAMRFKDADYVKIAASLVAAYAALDRPQKMTEGQRKYMAGIYYRQLCQRDGDIPGMAKAVQRTLGPHTLDVRVFPAEVVINVKADVQTMEGQQIAQMAGELLRADGLSWPEAWWAGGREYAKVSLYQKRRIIEKRLAEYQQSGRLKPGRVVVGFGDSKVDDFLGLSETKKGPRFLSFNLGPTFLTKDWPHAYVAHHADGRDRQEAAAFGPILNSLLLNHRVPEEGAIVVRRPVPESWGEEVGWWLQEFLPFKVGESVLSPFWSRVSARSA